MKTSAFFSNSACPFEFDIIQCSAAILEWNETKVTIHAFFSRGNILSEGGWVKEAISAYDIALRLKSDYTEVYYNRGTAKMLIAEHPGAIADLTKLSA